MAGKQTALPPAQVPAAEKRDGIAAARAKFLAGWCEPLAPGASERDGIRYYNAESYAMILRGEATTETAPYYVVTAHGCTCEGWQKGRSCYHVKGFMSVIYGPETARRAREWKREAKQPAAEDHSLCPLGDIPCAACGWMMPTTPVSKKTFDADWN